MRMEHISQLLIKEAKHRTFGRKMALFILVLEDGSIARLGSSTVTKADRFLETHKELLYQLPVS